MASPRGATLIAKRSAPASAALERGIYRDLLPLLPLRSLRYHGCLERDDQGFSWLFLEDAGDERFPAAEAGVLGRWLGTLHGSAASLAPLGELPARGVDHYFAHLTSARQRMRSNLDHPRLGERDRRALRKLASACDAVEAGWEKVIEATRAERPTLVHGDLVERNVRVRREPGAAFVLAFDWECAGRGLIAPDLQLIGEHRFGRGLPAYHAAVRRFWPELDLERLRRLAEIGHGLRLLASVDWASVYLDCPWPERGLGRLHFYVEPLARWAAGLAS